MRTLKSHLDTALLRLEGRSHLDESCARRRTFGRVYLERLCS